MARTRSQRTPYDDLLIGAATGRSTVAHGDVDAGLAEANDSLRVRVAELESLLTDSERERRIQTSARDSLETRNINLEKELSVAQERLQSLETTVRNLKAVKTGKADAKQLKELRRDLQARADRNQTLAEENSRLEDALAAALEKSSSRSARISELQKEVANTSKQLERMDNVRASQDKKTRLLAEVRQNLKQSRANNQILTQKVQELRAEREKLILSIQPTKDALARTKERLAKSRETARAEIEQGKSLQARLDKALAQLNEGEQAQQDLTDELARTSLHARTLEERVVKLESNNAALESKLERFTKSGRAPDAKLTRLLDKREKELAAAAEEHEKQAAQWQKKNQELMAKVRSLEGKLKRREAKLDAVIDQAAKDVAAAKLDVERHLRKELGTTKKSLTAAGAGSSKRQKRAPTERLVAYSEVRPRKAAPKKRQPARAAPKFESSAKADDAFWDALV